MMSMQSATSQVTSNIQALISTETDRHLIEVHEGCLTIGGKLFPDDCVSLTPDETAKVLEVLMIWQYGLEVIASDTTEE